DIFDRSVTEYSRLTTPDLVRSGSHIYEYEGSINSAWGLLPFETRYAGADPLAIAVGSISGQLRPDVVVATSFYFDPSNDYSLLLFRPENNNAFLPPLIYPYGQTGSFPSVAVVDLDGINGADVVVGGASGITRFR